MPPLSPPSPPLHHTLLSLFLIFSTIIPLLLSHQFNPTTYTPPLIPLPYATLLGTYLPTHNLTLYQRIPFGAPTSGRNRILRPQPPLHTNTSPTHPYNTSRPFNMCPQRTVNGSEDCLYLSVYSRPWTPGAKRPVLVSFYGGGFARGAVSFDVPPSGFPILNVPSLNDYVVVMGNYRTNIFGFLPGRRVREAQARGVADLNVGVWDQRAVLEWVGRWIGGFGGDEGDVTVMGQSAGGGSVVAHLIANTDGEGPQGEEKDDMETAVPGAIHGSERDSSNGCVGRWNFPPSSKTPLFHKALAISPFWPKTYRYDDPEAEEIYTTVVRALNCTKPSALEEMTCLKNAPAQALRDVSLRISDANTYTTSSYTWAPVIDDSLISAPLSKTIRDPRRKINANAVMSSYNLHEGTNFLPPGFSFPNASSDEFGFNSSEASFDFWVRGFLPRFSEEQIQGVREMYPASGEAEEVRWNGTYERAGMVYRDLVLACPAMWVAGKAESVDGEGLTEGKGWLVEYTVAPARHASDTVYWNTPNPIQISDPLTYQAYTGAMASFIQTGDPNGHKLTNATVPGVPKVRGGKQFLVTAGGIRQGVFDMLKRRCDFWLENAGSVPI